MNVTTYKLKSLIIIIIIIYEFHFMWSVAAVNWTYKLYVYYL